MDRRKAKIGGFTLIEIYTVMAIIAVLVSIAGLTTKARNENLALAIQHEKLRSLFIRAKSLAMSSVAPPGGGTFCGYGVSVNTQTREMFIFADNGFCEGGVPLATKRFDSGDVKLTSSLDLFKEESGIGFACFTSEASNDPDINFMSALCGKDFVFVPPDPEVYVNNKASPFPPAVIGVYSKRTPEKIRKVIVNQAGLIDAL